MGFPLAGAPTTFDGVVREAGVLLAWFTHRATRGPRSSNCARAHSARDRNATAVPAQQCASDASLRRRLEAAIKRNKASKRTTDKLRGALARALGEQRTRTVVGKDGW